MTDRTSDARADDLSTFWAQYAFSVGPFDFLRIDAALAAMVSGEWARFERRLTEGLACDARATAENHVPSQQSVDEAAIAFRYERDLVSGADITAWLDRNGLSTAAWMAFVARDLLRQTWLADIDTVLDRYSPSPRRLAAAALAEGICSGLFADFERSFRGMTAIVFDDDRLACASPFPKNLAHHETAARLLRQHGHWLDQVPEVTSRLRLIATIHDRFLGACSRLATDDALRDVVESNRGEWIRIDTDSLSFAEPGAAREAILCMTQDRLSIADVGALSRHPVIRQQRFASDVPPEHRHHLVSAPFGQIVGPLSLDGRFEVAVVTSRASPSLDDEAVARRARAVLLERLSAQAAREHVVCRPVSGV